MTSVPQPAVVCPTHYSPAHHTYLHHSPSRQTFPSPFPSQTATVWTETPMSLPSSPLIMSQQHSTLCHSLIHKTQDLLLGDIGIPSSTPSPTASSLALQVQPSSVISEPHMPLSHLSSPEFSHCRGRASSSIRPGAHSPPPQDGGHEGLIQSSGGSTQTGLGDVNHNPTKDLQQTLITNVLESAGLSQEHFLGYFPKLKLRLINWGPLYHWKMFTGTQLRCFSSFCLKARVSNLHCMKTSTEGLGVLALPYRNYVLLEAWVGCGALVFLVRSGNYQLTSSTFPHSKNVP